MKNFTFLLFLILSFSGYAQISIPIDFESSTIDYAFGDFNGGVLSVIDNPDISANNMSAKVAQMVKNPGEVFGGSVITLDSPIDFSTNKTFKMKVWSPAIGTKVLLKVENISNGGISFEKEELTTTAMSWEEMTFDFTAINTLESYQKIVLIFENGTAGDGSPAFTYYIDDIELVTVETVALPDLPITFEETDIDYALTDFEGAGPSTIVVDPTDASNMVVQVTKSSAAGSSAGTTIGVNGLANPIAFTAANTTLSVRVWSPDAGIPVRLKVENAGDAGISVETEATTTVAMAWETLEFNFANEATGTAMLNVANTYNKASIFFNFGVTGAIAGDKTYFFDDVKFGGTDAGSGIVLPVDFESNDIIYAFGDFGGGVLTVEANPDPSGINTSANVAQMVKNPGEVFGGSFFLMDAPIDFSTNKIFKMKVWSPAVGTKVLLKVENLNEGSIFFEKEEMTTTAMAWEEMTFDFSAINAAESYQKVVLIFDLGTAGDGTAASTYYFDDLTLVSDGMASSGITLPVDFESPTIDYVFGDFGGGVLSVQANPDPSGINTSATIGQMVKNPGEVFGGSSFELDAPIDFSTNKIFNMKVWAPTVGTKVLLKVENISDGSISFEKEEVTTSAMAWEEMTFDFTGINVGESYQKVVIIFELGTAGDGTAASTYYIDDLNLVAGGSASAAITLPVDFESNTINYMFGDFGGGVLSVEANPDPSGINTSATIAQMVKNPGEVFGGSSFELDAPIDFSTNKLFKMKVWAPTVGTKVLFKVENLSNGGIFFEQEEMTTTAMAWEEMTFDFSGINVGESYQKIVIIFELGTAGDGTAASTYYIDDIQLVEGGAPPVSEVVLPITFENSMIDYNLTDFGGNVSSIVVDPTDPNNMVGQAIKTSGAETFAGTTMSEIGLANPIPFTATDTKIKIRVWSPDAGIQVRLKTEQVGDPNISVETEATTTVAMAWETLEFDFANEATGTAALDPANTYDKITIFFNFGVSGTDAGEKTYYWDDVTFGARVSVLDVIANSPAHNTLEAAIIAAGLDSALNGAGPLTVFAPTDDAFANLPAGALDDLLADPTGALAVTLLYHVVGATVLSSNLTDNQTLNTLQGDDINVSLVGGSTFINNAMITTADIRTDNGIVHVIDAVLSIPTSVDIVSAAEAGINIAPNPSADFFNIQFPELLSESVHIHLYDLNGKLLKTIKTSNQITKIQIQDLIDGIYFLQIDTDKVSYFEKIIVK